MGRAVRLIGGILLLLVFGGLKADPYAEWAGWGDAWMKESGEKGVKLESPNAQMLELRHVGVPPYPGAKLTIVSPSGRGDDRACLLILGTNDDVAKIISFYQQTLDSDLFEFSQAAPTAAMFASKEKPDIISVVISESDIEDQFGFTKRITILFEALHGYKCLVPFDNY